MAAPEAAARKRRLKGHFAARAKRPRGGGGRQLEAGMRGILITCNMNERKCVGEAYSLLGEYGDLLYGPEQVRASVPRRGRGEGGHAVSAPRPDADRRR